jgi:hypothetical protein
LALFMSQLKALLSPSPLFSLRHLPLSVNHLHMTWKCHPFSLSCF